MLIGKPLASFEKRLPQDFHCQIDDSSVGIADEAFEAVAADGEGERGVAVVVEGTEGFVPLHPEPEPFGYGLDGK